MLAPFPRILVARSLRALADGYVAILLPAYLGALGMGAFDLGLIGSATLAGSAAATLALGALAHRLHGRNLLALAALLMAATGLAFGLLSSFWPLALVAFLGTLNPSSGDVSVFLPLEHARIAALASDPTRRTALFARYALAGSLFAALGGLAAAAPPWIAAATGRPLLEALRAMFLLYGAIGVLAWWLYRRGLAGEDAQEGAQGAHAPAPLRESRPIVVRLALLFSIDSFAGGLLVNSILALWLLQRHGITLAGAGSFFFAAGLLTTASQLAAPWVARRLGLLRTMVFTHIPANLLLVGAAFAPDTATTLALLLARSALSSMDVPARAAFVASVVTPGERVAAASFTAVPRSLASAAGPTIGGALLASPFAGAPLVACGLLKCAYDLALFQAFRRARSA